MPGLGITTTTVAGHYTTRPTAAGTQWINAVEQLSGGTQPGFPGALQTYWNGFGSKPRTDIPSCLACTLGLTGGTIGYADGQRGRQHEDSLQARRNSQG